MSRSMDRGPLSKCLTLLRASYSISLILSSNSCGCKKVSTLIHPLTKSGWSRKYIGFDRNSVDVATTLISRASSSFKARSMLDTWAPWFEPTAK
ncbi:hypothetical protein OGAPHI_005136 [Ogataea philodendri]|uniref:Uncharacterized protein n=1 Tax=Ogataea philodendri TaxID=1378263 RepID=A0A9P8P2Y3_9ASCO|nr:uncharacterized protein OGAPHI_005136 [Ogataea philodendri]KAH3663734.1 hypothetical protein OGAPHI_005136 [Ogataea philodendri]